MTCQPASHVEHVDARARGGVGIIGCNRIHYINTTIHH